MRDIHQINKILGRRLQTEDTKTFVNKDLMKGFLLIPSVVLIFLRVSHLSFDTKLITLPHQVFRGARRQSVSAGVSGKAKKTKQMWLDKASLNIQTYGQYFKNAAYQI